MKNPFILLLLLSVQFSFGTFAQEKNFDYGKVDKEGVYKNKYFGLEATLPKDWVLQNKEQMEQLTEMGKQVLSDDETVQKALDAADVNTAYLISLFKYEVGSAVNSNPSFLALAENTKLFPGIKTGKDYLFHAKNLLMSTKLDYTVDDDVVKKRIGTKDFYVMSAVLQIAGKSIQQDYITTVVNGFSLSFVLSYSDDDEKKELYKILDTVKI